MSKLNIQELKDCNEIKKIDKGFSSDLKVRVKFFNSFKLLRIYDIKIKEQVLEKLEKMKLLYELGVKCPYVYSYGECEKENLYYSLVEYVEGEDAEEALPKLSSSQQYKIGYDVGSDLRLIHNLEVKQPIKSNCMTRNSFDKCVKRYNELKIKIPFDNEIIDYIYKNINIKKIDKLCLLIMIFMLVIIFFIIMIILEE